jgi:hypothetical protein
MLCDGGWRGEVVLGTRGLRLLSTGREIETLGISGLGTQNQNTSYIIACTSNSKNLVPSESSGILPVLESNRVNTFC